MSAKGFTLLEVMVALAILAIALSTLLGSLNQSMFAADETDFSAVSAFLARQKMTELIARGTDLAETSGDFGENHPNYFWRVEINPVDFTENELLEGTEALLQRLDLVVHTEDDRRTFAVSRYILTAGDR